MLTIEDVILLRGFVSDRSKFGGQTIDDAITSLCDFAESVLTLQAQGAKMVSAKVTRPILDVMKECESGVFGLGEAWEKLHTAATDLLAEEVG